MNDPRRAGDPAPVSPAGSDFVDRVMSRVASGPSPSAPRSFLTAARERSLQDVRGSLAVAWHLALRSRVPAVVRVQALSLVVVVALSVGAASVAASAAAYRVASPLVASVIAWDTPDERSLPATTPVAPVASPSVDASPVPDPGPETGAALPDDGDGDAGRTVVRPGARAATGDGAGDLGDDEVDREGEDPDDAEEADDPDQDEGEADEDDEADEADHDADESDDDEADWDGDEEEERPEGEGAPEGEEDPSDD